MSGLDMWFRNDIEQHLVGLLLTMRDVAAAGNADPQYVAGYQDALRAVGASFGIRLPKVVMVERETR